MPSELITAEERKKVTNLNWTEDFGHENGQYISKCKYCGRQFQGHKRRMVCKLCGEYGNANDMIGKYERTLQEAIAFLKNATDDANGMVHCHDREAIRAFLQTVEGEQP